VSRPDLAVRLLDHARRELGRPALEYAEPPEAITGGYDTEIFGFRLTGATAEWARPLILRLLGPRHDPTRALREQTIQNVVAGGGFPAPRVLSASADSSVLGGAFLVMERLPGRPMLDVRRVGIASVMVDVHLRLHALDAAPLLEAMDRTGAREAVTLEGFLGRVHARVAGRPLDGLRAAMDWLTNHRPPPPERPAICHGDLHPQNIMVAGRSVTGVIDWSNTLVADPAYDVASTRVILSLVPLALSTMPALARAAIAAVRPLLLARFLAGYRRHRPIAPRVLAYYEAVGAMRQLWRITEARLDAAASAAPLNPLDASIFGARLCARFAQLTGITPTLPPI
jgi:aminoglycoside phosphotransferase (APT) family kinase protein